MEFKVGGKITLDDNEKYVIIDVMEFNNSQYLYCTTAKGNIKPTILKVGKIDGRICMKIEDNPLIIYELSRKILEKEDNETLKKLLEKK